VEEMQNYEKILDSWIEYLELEKFHNLEIKASKLNAEKRFEFRSFHTKEDKGFTSRFIEIKGNELILKIEVPEDEKDKEVELYIGFPIIERIRKNAGLEHTKYIPLFIIKRKCYPMEKEKSKKSFLELTFNTEADDDYFVAKPALSKLLDISPQEFDELMQKKPLISLLIDLLKEANIECHEGEPFEKVFHKFKKWLETRTTKSTKVALFDAIVTRDKDFEYFEGQKIEYLLRQLRKSSTFPLRKESIAYKYLYEEQTKSFEEYNESSSTPWFGTFHTFSLSRGQALLLQKKAEGENLIAVQGPPGTGKTTVLMAVIASTLTERALKLAWGKEDFSTIILVSSTANKAVDNAAREFEADGKIPKEFKEIPLYFEGNAFYFKGGKKKNIEGSIPRVEKLINTLKETEYDYDAYEKAKRELLKQYSLLKEIKGKVEFLIEKFKELEEIKKKLKELESEAERCAVKVNWNGTNLELLEVEKWIKKLTERKLNSNLLKKLNEKSFYRQTVNLKLALQNRSLIDRLVELFTGKTRKLLNKFLKEHRTTLEEIDFKFTLSFGEALNELLQLEQLITETRTLMEEKPKFIQLSLLPYWQKLITLEKKKSSLTKEVQEIKALIETIKKELNLENFKEQQIDFLTLWNLATVKENRKLFIKATKFLYFELLKRKSEVIEALEAFKLLMSGDKKAVEEIRKIGIGNFFKSISLVYPVHFSSLHSSPYLFSGLLKLLRENPDFKPIHLLYIDEAAMALPHLSYPVLYFSEKSIAVGDPLQLEPVVSVPEAEIEKFHQEFYQDNQEIIDRFSPARTSTYHRSARCKTGKYNDVGMACFLDTHRRCQKPIAKLFKEVAGYEMLNIATPELKGEALEKLIRAWEGVHLGFIDIQKGKRSEKNTNLTEAEVIEELVKHLQKSGYRENEIIVITPYVKQEKLLQKKLKELLPKGKIGTVHKFQGQEALVVIMSTVVQEGDSTSFIDAKPNLLNVAISRAKHLFIMVGSKEVLKNTNYFGRALKKIEREGICKLDKDFLNNFNPSS
jgi:DNA polymerase III delta prime subunit